MIMNEVLQLLTAFIAGGLIGAIFFGGLWWTVRRGMTSRYAAWWFTGSLVVRLSVTLAGFYFIGRDDWRRLLACLFGFVVARFVVMRWTGSRMPQQATHATPSTKVQNAS